MVVVMTMLNIVTLNQFSKVPMLVVHYLDHQHRDARIALADFMSMHYWGHDINDNDEEKDRQLPFKSLSANAVQHYVQPEPMVWSMNSGIAAYNPPVKTLYRQEAIPDRSREALFKPPRVVA